MPCSLTITLQSVDPARPAPHEYGRALHGIFYTWLRRGDPELANAVHGQDGPRPFTVSPLRQPTPGADRYAFRLTLLDDRDDLRAPLTEGMRFTREVMVEQHPCVMVLTDERPYRLTWKPRRYVDLLREARAETKLALRFTSPTTFRSRDMHYPLPDPVLVFTSYLTRWNAFAPPAWQINVNLLDVVAMHVAISRHQVRTEAADFGRYKQIGFVGQVHYRVLQPHKLEEAVLQRLNALADFASFCGTGHHTAQGLGQTRRIVGSEKGSPKGTRDNASAGNLTRQ